MKFTVIWKPLAERQLAELWNEGNDRNAISSAANELDRLLQRMPDQIGESRESNRRIVHIEPLAAVFEVRPEDRQVLVLTVWRS